MFKLAWKNTIHNPLNLLIGLILFSLGIGLISFLLLINTQLTEKFESNLADIDLVIGAKGSPLQLILCNMYHIDNPTGNIDIGEAKAFLNPSHPLLKRAVPLSLGDNYRTFRIVGTTHEFLDLYGGELDEGRMYDQTLEVVIGRLAADQTGLTIGDQFVSSHGFMEDEDLAHAHSSFKVVGILKPTGNVLDQLILTHTSSIWAVHEHEAHEEGEHDHRHEKEVFSHDNQDLLNNPDKQITALLIQYKSKTNFQSLSMARNINENTKLQAASPPYEINKLRDMIGIGTEGIRIIAWLIALVSALSIFISLYRAMKERKYEMALIRVMGGSRANLFMLVLFEGLILTAIGWALGTLIAHIWVEVTGKYLMEDFRYAFSGWRFLIQEWWLLLAALGIGALAGLIPAWQAARTDINQTLAK